MTVDPSERPAKQARRRGLGLLGRLGLVALVLTLGGVGSWLLVGASTPKQSRTAQDIPALQVSAAHVRPGSKAPRTVALKQKLPERSKHRNTPTPKPQASGSEGGALTGWAHRTAARTDVPERALRAYGNAELVLRRVQPKCQLSWATLAAIGRLESNHGRYGGSTLGKDGKPNPPIVGVPLDGSGKVKSVGDTDGGSIDGDPKVDRAVGPMQFIPSTWRKWASDGNGDGKGDPQQIDDAALTAARYVCAGGRDMKDADGWWSGIMSYNSSVEYGQKVFGLADRYARAAK